MKKIILALFMIASSRALSQGRSINKLTLETTYSYVEIHKSIRDLVDAVDKSSYFDDDFFNNLLKKIVLDKQFSDKEKVQIFYLMQKKLGYAFVGISYLPPKQNYFNFHTSEGITWQKTKLSLKDLNYDPTGFLRLVESERTRDAIVASNALLLASLLNTDSVVKRLEVYSEATMIMQCKNPDIFNHYVCQSASLIQDSVITKNLTANLATFKQEEFIEDVFCALYFKNNPVSIIKDYILQEQNPQNDLAIETALCALSTKVPPATFEKSIKSLISASKEKWKTDLLKNIVAAKVPFNYALTNKEQIVTKPWENVTLSLYTDGALISNGTILEFDPN
jgi:hypothetical protein